jgi:hypothetical protein
MTDDKWNKAVPALSGCPELIQWLPVIAVLTLKCPHPSYPF